MTDKKKPSGSKDYLSTIRSEYKKGVRPFSRAVEKATRKWKQSRKPKGLE